MARTDMSSRFPIGVPIMNNFPDTLASLDDYFVENNAAWQKADTDKH
jgi:hypothetical protein